MKNVKCDNCGADMEYEEGQYKCPYCGGIKSDAGERKEEVAEEVPARPLEEIRADYFSVYKKIKISFVVMIIAAVLGLCGGIMLPLFRGILSPSLIPIGVVFLSLGLSFDLAFGIFILHYYFNRFISVGNEYFNADKQQEETINKHSEALVRIWWIRYVCMIIPAAVFIIAMFIM